MTLARIVVPIDIHLDSQAALRTALKLRQQLKGELHLLHVVEGSTGAEAMQEARERLSELTLPAEPIATPVHRVVLLGKAPDEVLKYASEHQADMIVMGTRSQSGIARLALGSVALRVLKFANCPVVMVNPDGSDSQSLAAEEEARPLNLRASESPALDLIERAVGLRATDIHIDPMGDDRIVVRFRIDGKITTYCTLDAGVGNHLLHQFMTLAKLDVAEPFRPREGRLQLPVALRDIEVRATITPVARGEALALRLFSKDEISLSLDRLGLSAAGFETMQQILHGREGLVLVTGPTGSGKTTTVYSMLESFKGKECNIVSIEDPVEFSLPFVRQINVDERHDLTLTSGLRTLLRMDPDIIFVGEIRDPEAANIALRAASSGRFVFSSLHTRDVASTITVLRDLGPSDFSLASNLVGLVNQRLVRRLCMTCRQAGPVREACAAIMAEHGIAAPETVYESVGCSACRGTGFSGRCGVFETIACDGELSTAISDGKSEAELRRLIRSGGTPSLTHDALTKVRDGITSFQEAVSVRWL